MIKVEIKAESWEDEDFEMRFVWILYLGENFEDIFSYIIILESF